MANKMNMSLRKGRKRVRMQTRMAFLILPVAVIQLLVAAAVLVFGGEFRGLTEESYRGFAVHTADRSAGLERDFQSRAAFVQMYAEQTVSAAENALRAHGASFDALQTDDGAVGSVAAASAALLTDLLRAAQADEAFLILETGALYADAEGNPARAMLYLQNSADAAEQALCTDLQLEAVPIHGKWSEFSAVHENAAQTLKYTLPLTAADGTACGVLGIGLEEQTVCELLASRGADDAVCYVLGCGGTDGSERILAAAGNRGLLGGAETLRTEPSEQDGICRVMLAETALLGSVQALDGAGSSEQWALIAVAEQNRVLWQVLFLKRMLMTAAMLSLIAAAVAAVIGSRAVLKPLTQLSSRIRRQRKYNEVVRFESSGVYEIDEITDAVTQMQINVHGFSSQVSKMISIADVGLGTFLYNRSDDSVFVGESLIHVLRLKLPQGEDIVMSRAKFLESIENPAVRELIAAGLEMPDGTIPKDTSGVHEINRMSGSKLWMRLGFTYAPNTAIGTVQDITAAVMEKNRIEYERDYDHLTGLLNRQAYYRRVGKLFRDESELNIAAFIMVDLDNLKHVNDTYGHSFGDDYIKTAATALKHFQDCGGIVSRLSGDEFSACLYGFSSKDEVREIIVRVRDALMSGSCLLADGTHFKVSGSMGVSWYPDDSDSREQLMKYADFAMYTVKHSAKGGIAEFDRNAYAADSVLLADAEEMNRIIAECSVQYAFQSIVSAKTGEIYGYEALMRVQSDIFRSPLELLRTAKMGAKLDEIERLTMTKSLADFQRQIDAGTIDKTARIFINSVANNRMEPDAEVQLAKTYSHLLGQVVIEIPEREISDEECTAHKAALMREWGAQLALDAFGTGCDSEYALLQYHPNLIKIDRSVVKGCGQDADRRTVIENLVKLARAKDILVLAEGVETEAELETVIACGVDLLQGYYIAKPLFVPQPLSPALAERIRRIAENQ